VPSFSLQLGALKPPGRDETVTERIANMARANAILNARNYPTEQNWWSSDAFASLLALAVFRRTLFRACEP
jgi:hypothetical protein